MNSCGIYKIENLITHKVYIGQSIHIFQRWSQHFHYESMPWLHSLLYDDFAAYGIENFSFQILELCDEEQLNEREVYYIEKYNAYEDGLNSNNGNKLLYDEEEKEFKKNKKKMKDAQRREEKRDENVQKILKFDWTPYLDTLLFTDTQNEICNDLDIYFCNNKQIKFTFITNVLIENGYKVQKVLRKHPITNRRQRATIISK